MELLSPFIKGRNKKFEVDVNRWSWELLYLEHLNNFDSYIPGSKMKGHPRKFIAISVSQKDSSYNLKMPTPVRFANIPGR